MGMAKMSIARTIWRAAWIVPISILVMGGFAVADPEELTAESIDDGLTIEIPSLTAANITEADSIVSQVNVQLADLSATIPNLTNWLTLLLTSGLTSVEEQGPWHTTDDYQLIGVTQLVKLPLPLTLGPVVLPDVQYDLATDDYTPFLFHYDSITGLKEVEILIDLGTNLVVAIRPTDAATINPGAQTEFPTVQDGGLG